jgi:outer membrane protein OmpA-like peptidoglycan-associated protein
MARSFLRRLILPLGVLVLLAALAPAQDDPAVTEPVDPLATARVYKDRASKLGAKGNVPASWNAYTKRLDEAAAADTLTPAAVATLEAEGLRLVNRATFLREIKDGGGNLETLLSRYDRALKQVAALMDVPLDEALTGDQAAERLLDQLGRELLARQVTLDSLRVENRRLGELTGGRVAAQDSIITALRVELSGLRRQLWETELRAGVAEADRSAAESALVRRQEREQKVREIVAELGDEATVVLAPDGTLTMQVHGLDFGVGSASLAPGQARLMDALAAAVGRFPDAAVTVEGHTDDTGSRSANLRLSKRRADTVAGGLERRLELPEGSVTTVGHGPDRPVAPNSTAEGRARNRRIDIVVVPADAGP